MRPKRVKPETEIRNLKKELQQLRILANAFGMPLLLVYCPAFGVKNIKKKEPYKFNKKQSDWVKGKIKEFDKMMKNANKK